MKTTAAVLVETGKPLELMEIEVPKLKDGQVLVEVLYSGVCRTQVLECRGHRGEDKFLPHCLGHEGTGKVLEVGEGVTKVNEDDYVLLSWMKGGGYDVPGTVYGTDGNRVNAGGIATFMNYSVISENRLTRINGSLPLDQAALLGCAVPTGFGVLKNTITAQEGDSIAVFGVGGIGQCVVQAAKIAGCDPIIAVDLFDDKLVTARSVGATHLFNPNECDPVKEIIKIAGGGMDYAVEATGIPHVMAQALASVRVRGGSVVVIGNAKEGDLLYLDPHELNMGKKIFGTWGGDNDPDKDFPEYIDMFRSGVIDLAPLITQSYTLEQVNQAIDDLDTGKTLRPIIQTSTGFN